MLAGEMRARRRPVVGRCLEQLEARELLSMARLSKPPIEQQLSLPHIQGDYASIQGEGRSGGQIVARGNHRVSRSELIALPIRGIALTFAPIPINVPGVGPVSTGPITASLQPNRLSYALFDTTTRVVQTDQFLQFDFPLLHVIGGPPPTLEFREIGPVTIGVNPKTGHVVSLGNLRGGGTFDPGSVFASATMLVNDSTNIFSAQNPPLPSLPTPPVPYPVPFEPFMPGSLPDRRPLPAGFRPATDHEVQALFANKAMVRSSFSISGIFRAFGQAGDLPFGSIGHLGPFPNPALAGLGLA